MYTNPTSVRLPRYSKREMNLDTVVDRNGKITGFGVLDEVLGEIGGGVGKGIIAIFFLSSSVFVIVGLDVITS